MMRPTAVRSNQASVHYSRPSLISTSLVTPSVYQQQQQQILYAPISNPMVTLQPCGTTLHPSCVYPSVQPHIGSPNSIPLHLQGKNNRWHSKNKPSCGQQYYQQQLSYNAKPVVLYDQPTPNIAPISPSTASFLVASSTFTHAGSLPGEPYNNNSTVTHLLPQSFNFKPPDVQPFCFLRDRQSAQQQQQQQQQHHHPMQASYYNISATNTCSLQTVNANSSFPLPNPYANLTTFGNNQFSVPSSSLFSNPSVSVIIGPSRVDKPTSLPTLEFSSFKHNVNKVSSTCESQAVPPISHNENFNSWPPEIETPSKDTCDVQTADNRSMESTDRVLEKSASVVARADEEHYSDESSTSFDFTIEAEKMVSALCNTTSSNDLGKEESKPGNKTDSTPLFSGAGDNKASWFTDFCSEYENGTSIGVQTDNSYADRSQYPELIRKTVNWGCTEAEIVLDSNNDSQADSKRSWLMCLLSATRMAIMKSSTCIPVFADDRVFAKDLINALLRVSNGWLSLDNYMNKQHFPNLLDRLDPELITCFHVWEESTYELLKQLVQTFRKFGENDDMKDQRCNTICRSSSFPGDVALYTNNDLLVQLPANSALQRDAKSVPEENSHSATSMPLSISRLRNFQYNSSQQEQSVANQKESKLRSKWTITDNLSPAINTTKSVPNVSTCHTDISSLIGSTLRVKTASRKLDSAQKSLNAEFCQLRNKVMENSADTMRKQENALENKFSVPPDSAENTRLQHPTVNTPVNYSGLYSQNCLSLTFPLSGHPNPSYPTSNPGILTYGGVGYPSSAYPVTDFNSRSSKNPEQLYRMKTVNPVYVDRSQADQIELPSVPRNKVTLLSQIEPRTFDGQSEEMAANLSAWFASIRNAQFPTSTSAFEEGSRLNENSASRSFAQQEMPKYSAGLVKQPQIDANRQFQALRNLPNIQSTPWAASSNFGNRFQMQQAPEEYDSSEDVRVYMKPGSYNVPKKRHQRRSNRRSDDRNATQSRNNHHANSTCSNKGKNTSILASSTPLSNSGNISNATLIKTSFPSTLQLPTPHFSLENSPRILKRTESLSQNARQDVTWKAACASAEILLEALHVKDCDDTSSKIDCNDSTKKDDNDEETQAEASQQSDPKSVKRDDVDDCALSYEASEDDSESTCRLSPSTSIVSISREDENALTIKTNVKTDSWLIRTLNNASIVGKQKRCKNPEDRRNSVSSNNSETVDAKADHFTPSPSTETKRTPTTVVDNEEYPTIFSCESVFVPFSHNEETSTKESTESHVGKATYSETVRRSMKPGNVHLGKKETYVKSCAINPSMTTILPLPDHKCPKRNLEQSYQLLHKSQRWTSKKATRKAESNDVQLTEESSCAKTCGTKPINVTTKSSSSMKSHGKRKDPQHVEGKCASKSGWSVWYSSRRKQSISPLALSKLEMIYQTILQMDEAQILKEPFLHDVKDDSSSFLSVGTQTEDRSEVVQSPMFLEIVEYKLKNRIYHKVKHAVKDFRRVIHSARLCHQQDDERARKIDALSRKLEDLLEEHFSNWDFDNVIGSPREGSPLRFKTSGQKTIVGRCDATKKDVSSSVNIENSLRH